MFRWRKAEQRSSSALCLWNELGFLICFSQRDALCATATARKRESWGGVWVATTCKGQLCGHSSIDSVGTPQVTNVQKAQPGGSLPCPAQSCPSWGLGPAFHGFIPNPLGWMLARALSERFQSSVPSCSQARSCLAIMALCESGYSCCLWSHPGMAGMDYMTWMLHYLWCVFSHLNHVGSVQALPG